MKTSVETELVCKLNSGAKTVSAYPSRGFVMVKANAKTALTNGIVPLPRVSQVTCDVPTASDAYRSGGSATARMIVQEEKMR